MESNRLIIHRLVDRRSTHKDVCYGYFKTIESVENCLNIQLERILKTDLEGNKNNLKIERTGNLVTFNNIKLLCIESILVQE